jgi:hypothetical protein
MGRRSASTRGDGIVVLSLLLCHHHQVVGSNLAGGMSLLERLGHADLDRLKLYLVFWCLVCSGTIWSEQMRWIDGQKGPSLPLANRITTAHPVTETLGLFLNARWGHEP